MFRGYPRLGFSGGDAHKRGSCARQLSHTATFTDGSIQNINDDNNPPTTTRYRPDYCSSPGYTRTTTTTKRQSSAVYCYDNHFRPGVSSHRRSPCLGCGRDPCREEGARWATSGRVWDGMAWIHMG